MLVKAEVRKRGAYTPREENLQHDAAQQEAEANGKGNTQRTWDKEWVVKDEFTDTGCTGVIHLNRSDQRWVGRQNEQAGNRSERRDSGQRRDVQRQRHWHQRFRCGCLRVQQSGSKEEDDGQQPRMA